jgi:membrane protein required for beta-lactamase induction
LRAALLASGISSSSLRSSSTRTVAGVCRFVGCLRWLVVGEVKVNCACVTNMDRSGVCR